MNSTRFSQAWLKATDPSLISLILNTKSENTNEKKGNSAGLQSEKKHLTLGWISDFNMHTISNWQFYFVHSESSAIIASNGGGANWISSFLSGGGEGEGWLTNKNSTWFQMTKPNTIWKRVTWIKKHLSLVCALLDFCWKTRTFTKCFVDFDLSGCLLLGHVREQWCPMLILPLKEGTNYVIKQASSLGYERLPHRIVLLTKIRLITEGKVISCRGNWW